MLMPPVFEPKRYGPIVGQLVDDVPAPPLDAGRPNTAFRPALESLDPAALSEAGPTVDSEMAAACCAGLWLLHNFLDESHRISQSIETPTGSFWHGIMHRREGDFSNAKYWFRRVGAHPVFAPLAEAVQQLEMTSRRRTSTRSSTRNQRGIRSPGSIFAKVRRSARAHRPRCVVRFNAWNGNCCSTSATGQPMAAEHRTAGLGVFGFPVAKAWATRQSGAWKIALNDCLCAVAGTDLQRRSSTIRRPVPKLL